MHEIGQRASIARQVMRVGGGGWKFRKHQAGDFHPLFLRVQADLNRVHQNFGGSLTLEYEDMFGFAQKALKQLKQQLFFVHFTLLLKKSSLPIPVVNTFLTLNKAQSKETKNKIHVHRNFINLMLGPSWTGQLAQNKSHKNWECKSSW